MIESIDVLGNMVNFLAVAIIFILTLWIVFKLTLKNYNAKSSKIKFYGLFLGMDNRSIISFSMITLNYIFLIWLAATFSQLNIIYAFIIVFLMIGADIIIKDYNAIPGDLLYCTINCLCIYVINLIYDYLTTKYTTVLLLIILGLVVIFVFLYFTYITFKILNNIVLKQAYLQKKEYKKI